MAAVPFQEMYKSIEYPLHNLDVINKGKCRMCSDYNQEPTNENDIEALKLHYSTSHKIIKETFPGNPAATVYKQEIDSRNLGKHYTHTYTHTSSLFLFMF